MSSTFTSGKPTRSSHMRVGSDSTGVLQSEGIENRQIGRAPATRQGPLHPVQIRSARFVPVLSPHLIAKSCWHHLAAYSRDHTDRMTLRDDPNPRRQDGPVLQSGPG